MNRPTLFQAKRWAELQRLEVGDDLESQLLRLWCALEQGPERPELIDALKTLFSNDRGGWALDEPWGLWEFRRRFGPTTLIRWGIHDRLVSIAWALTAASLRNERPHNWNGTTFTSEWVGLELRAFLCALRVEARPPAPWQLGGCAPLIGPTCDLALRAWVLEATAQVPLTRLEADALRALRQHDQRALRAVPATELRGTPHDVFASLARQDPLADVIYAFGLMANERLLTAQNLALAQELDQLLLVHDLRDRLPQPAAHRAPHIKRVIFRATPRRALDLAIAEVAGDHIGVLARHQLERAQARTHRQLD